MPVYGNMLQYFPELMANYEVFKMKPSVGAGYGQRYDKRKVRGYWSWRKQSKMDIEGDLRTPDHQATFWVHWYFLGKRVVVEQNDFIEVDGKVFVVIDEQDFSREGGFTKCLMQKLAGVTDQQITNTKVDEAIRLDY